MGDPSGPQRVALLVDSLEGQPLVYSNERGDGFRYYPERLAISLVGPLLHRYYPGVDRARLVPPEGWELVGDDTIRDLGDHGTLDWTFVPRGTPESCRLAIVCELYAGERRIDTVAHELAIELRGRSQFDPRRHALPFRNAAAELGSVEPSREVFARTYSPGGMVLRDAFFRGLYRDIVFLTDETDARGSGGLCTGMARVALERSLVEEDEEPRARGAEDREALRERVEVWHGRQLTDRALRAAAPWFFQPSPTAAMVEFCTQLLETGRGTVVFDIGIARWQPSWAILRRLVRHGHTVVPYAFQQADNDSGLVFVYDPSYPFPEDLPHNVIRFDLRNDRYAYRGFGSLAEDEGTTIIAADQDAFREPGTAYVASLASLALHPETLREEWRENRALRRNALLAGVGLLGWLVFALARRRRALA